jgi:ribosomal-protein-alanine N-acetyltransferase
MKPVGPAHAAVFAAIHATAFPDEPWDEDSFAVLLGHPGVFGLLDDRGGMILCRVAADEAEILTIGVTARRQGIGRGLLAAGVEQARALGAAAMFLEVAAGNVAARGLYAAAGFGEVGVRRGYYADDGDAVVLRLGL